MSAKWPGNLRVSHQAVRVCSFLLRKIIVAMNLKFAYRFSVSIGAILAAKKSTFVRHLRVTFSVASVVEDWPV